jgi:prevent-host-death family protein
MKRTSITDAKNGLSALLDRVRHGETIVIEDRGVPVARRESVAARRSGEVEGRAARLERQGVLRPALAAVPKRLLTTAPPAPKRGAALSDAVLAERRDGR